MNSQEKKTEVKSLDEYKPIEEFEEVKLVEEIKGLDDIVIEDTIILISKDTTKFTIRKKALYGSVFLKTIIEGDPSVKEIELPSVNANTLTYIVQYLESLVGEEEIEIIPKIKSNVFSENVKRDIDVQFVNNLMRNHSTAKKELYDLIEASNYMDINSLLHLLCTKVACMLKGRSLEDISKIISLDTPYQEHM